MSTAWAIGLIAGALGGAGCAGYWGALLGYVVHGLRTIPTARSAKGARVGDDVPSVCAIVPAHNERGCIADHVRSLRRQDYPRLRVVLALDRCADGTADAARAAIEAPLDGANASVRFEIVEIESCPDGWAGKTHAAWEGLRRSEGARGAEMLAFIDADTVLKPWCVRATASLLRGRSLDMLSLLSTLTHERWFERVAQPCAALELVRQYPLQRANAWPKPRSFANGQYMLFRRDAYERVGGHEAVSSELLEDIALSRRIKRVGGRIGVFLAHGAVVCRMYEGWAAFRRGWKRIYTESCRRREADLRQRAWRAVLTETALPLLAGAGLLIGVFGLRAHGAGALTIGTVALGAIGVAAWVASWWVMLRMQRAPLWAAPLTIVGGSLVAGVMLEAARDLRAGRATEWGGRSYVLANRDVVDDADDEPAPPLPGADGPATVPPR